jgi:hypothetical protein
MTAELCSVMRAIDGLRRHSNKEVNRAGDMVRDLDAAMLVSSGALVVIADWRDTHQGPMTRFREHLASHATAVDAESIVVSRLKRLATTLNKLFREPRMKLSTMQDVGGLRAIVDTPAHVYALAERLLHVPQFELKRQTDYIRNPPVSGYRGIHHIYTYHAVDGDPPNADGLKIEVQIRSRLEHAWATAVEVVGTFRRELLKAGEGDANWLRFFALAGALIAKKDGTPLGSHVPADQHAFWEEFIGLRETLCVFQRLKAYVLTPIIASKTSVNAKYFVLSSNIEGRYMSMSTHPVTDFEGARRAYRDAEQRYLGNPLVDTVLVRADDLADLAEAYPNYWADTSVFTDVVYEDSPRR